MKRIFLLLFILALPLALAVSTVTVDESTYTLNEPVTISVTGCVGSTLLDVINPTSQAVFSDQGNGDWSTTYHTSSDPSTGTYIINAYCGADTFSTTFDVGEEDITPAAADAAADDTTTTGGGGGRRCTPLWSCGYWSICGPDLIQTRTCTDERNCERDKTESRACAPCDESWVCSVWSVCANQKQTRICTDEHLCGTTTKKPILQKACDQPDTGPPPARIAPPKEVPPPTVEPSFWDKYKVWIILIPIILILIAAAIFIYFRYFRKPGEGSAKPGEGSTNLHELKNWTKTALARGASKDKIKETIKKHGEWSSRELRHVFKELEKEKAPVK